MITRALELRSGARLRFREGNCVLLLRGEDQSEGWSSTTQQSETWTEKVAEAEGWNER